MTGPVSARLGLRTREVGPGDTAVLREATLDNLNWSGSRFTAEDVRTRAEFGHYARLDPSRGDLGLVAVGDDGWAGVAWVVVLPPEDAGYGFVAPGVGEVSLSVRVAWRRRGLGRELLLSVLALARDRGHHRLSLSVESGNPAAALYRSVGFVDAEGPCAPGTMVLGL